MTYIPDQPTQGKLYHLLQVMIANGYSGLGPNNVGQNPYRVMTGQAFQKPISRVTGQAPIASQGFIHR